MCEKRFTFLYTSPFEHVKYKVSNITFRVLRLSTFVLNKCTEIIIFTIIFVVKMLKGFIGIMLAQRRRRWPSITSALGQCIVVSGDSGAEILKVTFLKVQSPLFQ